LLSTGWFQQRSRA